MNPVKIVFRHTASSPAVISRVEEEVEKLRHFCDAITRCRVVIEAPHPHHRHGGHFSVRVELRIPRHEIVVHHDPSVRFATQGALKGSRPAEVDVTHKDVYVAIRDAFDATRRRLEDQVRKMRTRVKQRAV